MLLFTCELPADPPLTAPSWPDRSDSGARRPCRQPGHHWRLPGPVPFRPPWEAIVSAPNRNKSGLILTSHDPVGPGPRPGQCRV